MLKKVSLILLVAMVSVSLTGCGEKIENKKENGKKSTFNISFKTYEEAEQTAKDDVEKTITSLGHEWESLSKSITTYDQYSKNIEEVEKFYDKVTFEVTQLCIRLRKYSVGYAQLIMNNAETFNDKYEDLENIYDELYENAGDDLYDEIYGDLFNKIYDHFYDGILDAAYDTVPYSEWSSTHSKEYKWWSRAHSDIYDEWSDMHSDIYDFYSDMRSEIYGEDIEGAVEEIDDFKEDIEKLIKKNS